MPGMRVYEIAKESGRSSRVVIKELNALGFHHTSASATLRPKEVEAIRRKFAAEGPVVTKSRTLERIPPPTRPPRSRMQTLTCPCCQLKFESREDQMEAGKHPWCEECRTHYEIQGEDAERVRRRQGHHEVRLRDFLNAARAAEAEAQHKAQMGYRSRNVWRAALVEVMLEHEKGPAGGCNCGSSKFPCRTVRRLEETNKGIARQVEKFATMTDEQLRDELYRDIERGFEPE